MVSYWRHRIFRSRWLSLYPGSTKGCDYLGGENVYPAEVERVLIEYPAVADVAIFGVPDEKWGETVKAAVVLSTGNNTSQGRNYCLCAIATWSLQIPQERRLRWGTTEERIRQGPEARLERAILDKTDTEGELSRSELNRLAAERFACRASLALSETVQVFKLCARCRRTVASSFDTPGEIKP